ncbi:aspartate 1-decarboxylase [Paenibacillus illinoisensis]|uniref:aspartate 1-decarboxylase n=1 Tax=Paenibacillus illinoisensis TaxID=59845 RepID=UPI001C8D3008|nr:aspartate 1-decarboxylase [Paenibacillus illinoisensis]MBY0217732.1 aspartate 1-decarboxylase [Paenibacillus illinoisensis]
MFKTMLSSKIHRATVTEANLNYVGSITIDEDILELADILPNEKVQVVNINNGERFETYTITGPRKSGAICVNGAAARLVQPGDKVIIISYVMLSKEEALKHVPTVVLAKDRYNNCEKLEKEMAFQVVGEVE